MVQRLITNKYGVVYENYKGRVWITKQRPEDRIQGTNIAVKMNGMSDNELHLVSYVIRRDNKWCFTGEAIYTLDEIVWKALKNMGWFDHVCEEMLAE